MAHILVVEDEVALNDLIAAVLDHAGHALLRALDGMAAMRLARRARPDLIVMDLRLPTMDGGDVIRQLKADPYTCHIPIIAISASATLRAEASDLPVDAVISKPFDIDELVAEVTVQLQRAAIVFPAPGATTLFTTDTMTQRPPCGTW
jgi:DNA-binding response OmpR family regulator